MDDKSIQKLLNEVDPDTLEKVLVLLSGASTSKKEEISKGKRTQSARKERLRNKGEKKEKPKKLILPEDDSYDEPLERPIQRPARSTRQPTKKVHSQGERACRIEPMDLRSPRHNEFEKMPDKNKHKEDTELQKKFDPISQGKSSPTQRREPFEYLEVQCNYCHNFFEVHPSLTYYDREEKQYIYTCDRCRRRA